MATAAVYSGGNTAKPVTDDLTWRNSVATGVTAHAGGGQTDATLLAAGINEVATVATAADSVKLPVPVVGLRVVVINSSANSMQVFGSGTDTINAVATGTGVAHAAGKTAEYVAITSGTAAKWFRLLSA